MVLFLKPIAFKRAIWLFSSEIKERSTRTVTRITTIIVIIKSRS